MAKRRTLVLSLEQRAELEAIRNRDPRPYMREKAAALLKIADGMTPHAVACHGLLRCRDPDTVYGWLDHYELTGTLKVRPACRRLSPL